MVLHHGKHIEEEMPNTIIMLVKHESVADGVMGVTIPRSRYSPPTIGEHPRAHVEATRLLGVRVPG